MSVGTAWHCFRIDIRGFFFAATNCGQRWPPNTACRSTTHAALARRLAGVGSDATRRVLPQGCFPASPRPTTDLLNANGPDCLGKPQMLLRTHCGRQGHPDEGVDARRQAETETSIDRYSEIPCAAGQLPSRTACTRSSTNGLWAAPSSASHADTVAPISSPRTCTVRPRCRRSLTW
jgi:hypothetical protein